jgi:IS5 family transposase
VKARLLHEARRNKPLRPWQTAFNKAVSRIRVVVERPFAAMKGPCAMARLRYRGLACNDGHVQLFACACNLRTASGLTR